jgi:hypothetical protein
VVFARFVQCSARASATGRRRELQESRSDGQVTPRWSDEVFCPSSPRLCIARHSGGKRFRISRRQKARNELLSALQVTVLRVVVHNAFPGADIED